MDRPSSYSEQIHSDFGIYEDFYAGVRVPSGKLKKAGELLLCRLTALLHILCSSAVRRLAKTAAVALCLIGMIGVAGAMEIGNLPLGAGVLICAGLLIVEFLLLRRRKDKRA